MDPAIDGFVDRLRDMFGALPASLRPNPSSYGHREPLLGFLSHSAGPNQVHTTTPLRCSPTDIDLMLQFMTKNGGLTEVVERDGIITPIAVSVADEAMLVDLVDEDKIVVQGVSPSQPQQPQQQQQERPAVNWKALFAEEDEDEDDMQPQDQPEQKGQLNEGEGEREGDQVAAGEQDIIVTPEAPCQQEDSKEGTKDTQEEQANTEGPIAPPMQEQPIAADKMEITVQQPAEDIEDAPKPEQPPSHPVAPPSLSEQIDTVHREQEEREGESGRLGVPPQMSPVTNLTSVRSSFKQDNKEQDTEVLMNIPSSEPDKDNKAGEEQQAGDSGEQEGSALPLPQSQPPPEDPYAEETKEDSKPPAPPEDPYAKEDEEDNGDKRKAEGGRRDESRSPLKRGGQVSTKDKDKKEKETPRSRPLPRPHDGRRGEGDKDKQRAGERDRGREREERRAPRKDSRDRPRDIDRRSRDGGRSRPSPDSRDRSPRRRRSPPDRHRDRDRDRRRSPPDRVSSRRPPSRPRFPSHPSPRRRRSPSERGHRYEREGRRRGKGSRSRDRDRDHHGRSRRSRSRSRSRHSRRRSPPPPRGRSRPSPKSKRSRSPPSPPSSSSRSDSDSTPDVKRASKKTKKDEQTSSVAPAAAASGSGVAVPSPVHEAAMREEVMVGGVGDLVAAAADAAEEGAGVGWWGVRGSIDWGVRESDLSEAEQAFLKDCEWERVSEMYKQIRAETDSVTQIKLWTDYLCLFRENARHMHQGGTWLSVANFCLEGYRKAHRVKCYLTAFAMLLIGIDAAGHLDQWFRREYAKSKLKETWLPMIEKRLQELSKGDAQQQQQQPQQEKQHQPEGASPTSQTLKQDDGHAMSLSGDQLGLLKLVMDHFDQVDKNRALFDTFRKEKHALRCFLAAHHPTPLHASVQTDPFPLPVPSPATPAPPPPVRSPAGSPALASHQHQQPRLISSVASSSSIGGHPPTPPPPGTSPPKRRFDVKPQWMVAAQQPPPPPPLPPLVDQEQAINKEETAQRADNDGGEGVMEELEKRQSRFETSVGPVIEKHRLQHLLGLELTLSRSRPTTDFLSLCRRALAADKELRDTPHYTQWRTVNVALSVPPGHTETKTSPAPLLVKEETKTLTEGGVGGVGGEVKTEKGEGGERDERTKAFAKGVSLRIKKKKDRGAAKADGK